ncbi:MAG: NAD(P)-dependent alcohol dehydrogenase [Bacteroidia bacterium]|nr:NAD(P)-dependent alcohol dehydrogenase [Bacteroidia bacterium]
MTYEQAAAIPQAAVMALQGIRDYGKVLPGQKVLINGAGGGVGTFAIQLAKYFGAEVTAVDSTSKLEMMRSLGADHLIDYSQVDFIKNGELYDLIIDVVANRSIFEYKRALKPAGIFVMIGGTTLTIFQTMLLGPLLSMSKFKKLGVLMHEPNKNLETLKEFFEAGSVKPVIDKCFTLSDTAEAMRYLGEGKAKGKVVISI